MSGELVLYRSIASRSITALWMLEELGVSYRMETFDVAKGETASPEYRALNPHGRVPMVVDGDIKLTESPAICLYLADRYGYGGLAPRIEEAARGPYMSWTIWATAALEPASTLAGRKDETKPGDWGFGFGAIGDELDLLEAALEASDHLAGGRFTAADVMVGAVVAMRSHTGQLPVRAAITRYNERNMARPAFQRAAQINWPPEVFGAAGR